MNRNSFQDRTPSLARAGSASFEDPVLQSVYQFLTKLAAGRPEIIGAFCAYTGERVAMFLPPPRAALISDVMLRKAVVPASVAPPERHDHQVYLTVNLVEAVSTLPEPWKSELDGEIGSFGWAAPWLEITRGFIGKSAAALAGDFVEFQQAPCEPQRIGIRQLSGVLRALKIEGHWFVRHDCADPFEILFSGLPWPAGHSQWLKEADVISIGDQTLDVAAIEFLRSAAAANPCARCFIHSEPSGFLINDSAPKAAASIAWKNGWLLTGLSGVSTPVLPNDQLVIGGKSIPAFRLLRGLLPDERRNWSLQLRNATLRFADDQSGLDDITLALEAGDMVAVMGPSGCGKTTLMGVISGDLNLSSGSITIQGGESRKPVFALVPQDDVLFSELTAAENLRYAAALRSSGGESIATALAAVGLEAKGGLTVGSVTEKVLSGGERKRLNIGLELTGSPDALLLDEPTSGLSSADADSVMRILRHRADLGVLVMAVIHQPSMEVFLKFDKVIVLDVGGRLAFFGTPAATQAYFGIHVAGASRQNWGPDRILDTLVGRRTTLDGRAQRRNFDPAFWKLRYAGARAAYEPPLVRREIALSPPASKRPSPAPRLLKIPLTLLSREMLRRARGWRAILASCLIAIALAAIVAWVCRVVSGGNYSFTANQHLPAFCFLNVILIQFLALSSSVQELVKDRTHRLRERLLKVPGALWLFAKLPGLALQTSLQAALVVITGGWILGLGYGKTGLWIALTLAGWASLALGLFISALPRISERVALAAVPLLLVPQMILCGAVPFEFKNLAHLHWPFPPPPIHENRPAPAPWIAEIMPSRWAYQASIRELRDDPAILDAADLKPLFRTYNFARGLTDIWKSDPAAFLDTMEKKTGRRLTEMAIRHEISLLVLNDKRSSAEVAETFGGLVPQTAALQPVRNEFFLEYASSLFPKTAIFLGRPVSAAVQARMMLAAESLIFLLLAAIVMTLSPRLVTDFVSLFGRRKSPKP